MGPRLLAVGLASALAGAAVVLLFDVNGQRRASTPHTTEVLSAVQSLGRTDVGTRLVRPTISARWAMFGEEKKSGYGLLFFAYGGSAQIEAFLGEATLAAASFRRFNPRLPIAIVTNNATGVDKTVFTHHVVPRDDLLFVGSVCPDVCRGDRLPRQWTTRLYYMAHSPFEYTWAFDSNVYACPGSFAWNAMDLYLQAAARTSLWGYDIAHANSSPEPTLMYPHCFALLFKWNGQTSNLFRDWFMLMLRRGISTNDQDPLRIAEIRQAAAAWPDPSALRVGQLPTEFAAAFYSVGGMNTFYPRISRQLRAAARVVHGTPIVNAVSRREGRSGPELCRAFNARRGRLRRLFKATKRSEPETLLNASACRAAVSLPAHVKRCPFGGGALDHGQTAGVLPTKLESIQSIQWWEHQERASASGSAAGGGAPRAK